MNNYTYINIIQTTLSVILDYFIIKTFIQSIFKEKNIRCNIVFFYGAILLVEIVLLVTGFILTDYTTPSSIAVKTSVSILSTLFLAFFYTDSLKSSIFAAFSFQIMVGLSERLCYIIALRICSHNNTSIANIDQLSFFITMDTLSKLLLLIMVFLFIIIYKKEYKNTPTEYSILLFFTPVISCCMLVLIPSNDAYINQEAPFYYSLWIFIALINTVNISLLNKIRDGYDKHITTIQLNNQLEFQKDKYTQLSETYKTSRRIIHDAKHHCSVLKNAIISENYDTLSDYLVSLAENLESTYTKYNTGNLVIDSLITNYSNLAVANKIEFNAKLDVEYKKIPVSEYDLSIILGNLMDNCLNACINQNSGEKSIKVNIATTHNNMFIIIIENTYNLKGDSNDHTNSLYHGFALKNIETVVEKYRGIMAVNPSDTYTSTVIIPITT